MYECETKRVAWVGGVEEVSLTDRLPSIGVSNRTPASKKSFRQDRSDGRC